MTESGKTIEGDVVVVGAGVKPDVMLAAAGRAGGRRRGILCDATLQTSVEGIYAAGDVCSYDSVVHGRRLRVEHWDVAMQQGMHAARRDDRRGASRTRSCRTSSATSPTGRASSTSGPATRLGRGDLARRPRRGRVRGLLPEGRQGRRRAHASSARRTSATRGRCWRRASTSAATRRRRCSGTPTATSAELTSS